MLPPLTGFSPLAPLAASGKQLILLQGSGFRPGFNAAFTSEPAEGFVPGPITTSAGTFPNGVAAGSVLTTNGPLEDVSVDGSRASVVVDFQNLPGTWHCRIIDPGNIAGEFPHDPEMSPWFDFQTIGAALALDPGYARYTNPDGSVGIGRIGPMAMSYDEVVDVAATAERGTTVLRPGYTFAPDGSGKIYASGNAGYDNGGSPVDPTRAAATGPGPGGGIAFQAVADANPDNGVVAASQRDSSETWMAVAVVAVLAYIVWRS